LILLGFRISGFIGRVFMGWVFTGCSPRFEHRVFMGVFMGVHGEQVIMASQLRHLEISPA